MIFRVAHMGGGNLLSPDLSDSKIHGEVRVARCPQLAVNHDIIVKVD